ncbi:Holliday junction ATP-dependent DNA helicase RuvA [Luteitalea sp. TBR-22]|uniref:Holliday junction branch migration protein RuvA n=1 Tax=Luteitalea sp. TBR-22 TaxID=2802971 RepID=UPI001AF22CE1|nr:Holliday junction branch migration protein RuvA [Luteitalea sp. TBR-22]BCS31353.1 Holliday junction ATP-dependent DNA helicase RuvA [Luteitalea sp. TBR-22]
MIAALRGRLIEKQPARLIVDVGGVGYDVQVPLSTYGSVGEVGGELSLRVHTHVREEQIALFGFLTALEQQIFERLISVNGIGPKVALAVLSGIAPGDLVAAVQGNEPARLTTIPGIGRKTAERIVLELRDRLPAALPVAADATGPGGAVRADLISALVNLGYPRPTVEKAVGDVLKAQPSSTFDEALRQALGRLARA